MSNKPPPIDERDKALFRDAAAGSRRLHQDKIDLARARPRAVPRQRWAEEQQVLKASLSDPWDGAELETGEELLFSRNGVQSQVMRKLRRGQFRLEAELDLHRLTRNQAREAITGFLQRCRQQGWRCVRIIHGKGLGSHNKTPVLKTNVNHWLRQRDEVLAFCSARPADGGTGAVYVLLKRPR
jgi:DNA-nicking Smr family endonuclease